MRIVTLLLAGSLGFGPLGCRPPPVQVERRVPVDVVGDCVALRQGIAACGEAFTDLLLQRRQQGTPDADPDAARAGVAAELLRERDLPLEERVRQCRAATADAPPPSPEDVARLHACLSLPCRQRAACLGPLLMGQKRPS